MAPIRRPIGRDKFSSSFSTLKTQSFNDPPSRNPQTIVHRTLSWNASGGLIATGATDKTIRIWNPERASSKSQTELRGHSHTPDKVLFNPVREFELASCSSDGVRFWDTRSRSCISKVTIEGDPFTLAWSSDGSVLMAGTKDDRLSPILTSIPASPTVLATHKMERQTNQTAFSNAYPPRDLVITQGDGGVKVLDYPSFGVLHAFSAHTSSCQAIAYAPDGGHVAVGGSDAMISLWDTGSWVCKRTLSSRSGGAVRGLSWSWDGKYIVGASEEVMSGGGGSSGGGGNAEAQGLDIFHAESGEVVHTVPTNGAGVPAVQWHPNRYWLAYTVVDESRKGNSGLRVIGAGGGPTI